MMAASRRAYWSAGAPLVTFADIMAASKRIAPHAARTPLLRCAALDALAGEGVQLFLKCENMQVTGSFKARGALNAVLSLPPLRTTGIVAHSAGNHAAAVAYAAKAAGGLPCHVVIPRTAPRCKVANTEAHGATVELCEPTNAAREVAVKRVSAERGYAAIHPYNDAHVVAGQGTLALELFEQLRELGEPPLDALLVPVSGGGMLAGVAVAASGAAAGTRVIAVEPQGKRLAESLAARERLWPPAAPPLSTIADGCRTQPIGELTWPLCLEHVDPRVVTVSDDAIVCAMRALFEVAKLVVEPSGAMALAAAVSSARSLGARRVGLVLCGGNADLDQPLPWASGPGVMKA